MTSTGTDTSLSEQEIVAAAKQDAEHLLLVPEPVA